MSYNLLTKDFYDERYGNVYIGSRRVSASTTSFKFEFSSYLNATVLLMNRNDFNMIYLYPSNGAFGYDQKTIYGNDFSFEIDGTTLKITGLSQTVYTYIISIASDVGTCEVTVS